LAKAAIRKLKTERFWRWLCVEVYGKPAPKKPIKLDRRVPKFNKRKHERFCDRAVVKVMAMIEERRKRTAEVK
jgi:hypothetical protein